MGLGDWRGILILTSYKRYIIFVCFAKFLQLCAQLGVDSPPSAKRDLCEIMILKYVLKYMYVLTYIPFLHLASHVG